MRVSSTLLTIVLFIASSGFSWADERTFFNNDGSVTTIDFARTSDGKFAGIAGKAHYESRADYAANRPATFNEAVAKIVLEVLFRFLNSEQGKQFLSNCKTTASKAMDDASNSISNAYDAAAVRAIAINAKRREYQAAATEAYEAASKQATRAANWATNRYSDTQSLWNRYVYGK